DEARLPDRAGRQVVVVLLAPFVLERQVVDPLAFLRRAKGEEGHDLRLPTGEESRAVRAWRDGALRLDRPDLVGRATVGPPLLDGDLVADEPLVGRLRGLLDELLPH